MSKLLDIDKDQPDSDFAAVLRLAVEKWAKLLWPD